MHIYLFSGRRFHRPITMRSCERRKGYATIRSYVICLGSN